jgi:peptide/nickel transport system substrate-binding protein
VQGVAAEGLMNDTGSGTRIVASKHASCQWIEFPDQWDPKSPWHDIRMRQAVAYAIDRDGINKISCLGFCPPAGVIIPSVMPFALQVPAFPYDPRKSRQLLAEAGYPDGFDVELASYVLPQWGAAVQNYLQAVGIRAKLRPTERAAFVKGFSEKKYKNIIQAGPGAFGNAATRIEAHLVKGGVFSYGSYPDIDELYKQQAVELDRAKREAILHKMQQIVHERTMYSPIWQLAFINGHGPRVGESGFGLIAGFPYTAPYEDLTLKAG